MFHSLKYDSKPFPRCKLAPSVIPNKHTEKVKSNKKRPGEKLGCAFSISVEYKIKRKFTFSVKYQIYFILCGENNSILTRATHSWKILIFHRTRWNIFGIHLKKVNILYILKFRNFDPWPLKIQNGHTHAYCNNISGKIHQKEKG